MKTPVLGQHFLTSRAVAQAMVEAGNVGTKDIVLEAGPGKGILTEALLKKAKKVIAVEKDAALTSLLEEKFKDEIAGGRLILIRGDILTFIPEHNGLKDRGYKVVANIPYYITGQFLRHFLSHSCQPENMTLLLQKEVAERIACLRRGRGRQAKSTKESLLSISVKAYGKSKYIKTVKAGSFYPKPKVDSAILTIESISRKFFKDISEEAFFKILKAGFAHKRKLLARNLEAVAEKKLIQGSCIKCGISSSIRAEDISLSEWHCLSKNLQ